MSKQAKKFTVARVINVHGERDYLCSFDKRWGTACSGRPVAMIFATKSEADVARAKAASLVPTFLDGRAIQWVVEAA